MDVKATEAPIVLKKRRRLSLSVRALMVVVLAIGGGLGWITYRARVQREAVAAIRRAGGSVGLNIPWNPKRWLMKPVKPPGPAWMRRLLGPGYFDTVTAVRFSVANPQRKLGGDQILQAACKLPSLEELAIVYTDATDAGVEGVGNLAKLKTLDFRMNQMTARAVKDFGRLTELRELTIATIPLEDQDMGFLKSLTKLEKLSLMGKELRLTEACLKNIRDLTGLQLLELPDVSMTTQGLRDIEPLINLEILQLNGGTIDQLDSLRSLTKLYVLTLSGNPIDDDDLAVLKTLPKLYALSLRKTKITDRGLAILATCPSLTNLDLGGTAITDAGLMELAKFPKLREFRIRETKISDEALAAFRKAHPKITVHR